MCYKVSVLIPRETDHASFFTGTLAGIEPQGGSTWSLLIVRLPLFTRQAPEWLCVLFYLLIIFLMSQKSVLGVHTIVS